jgi:hypothetical protein
VRGGARRIVEIDGATHSTDTELLPAIRNCATTSDTPLTNEDVYRNRDSVLAAIFAKLAGLPLILAFSPHSPSRDGRSSERPMRGEGTKATHCGTFLRRGAQIQSGAVRARP